MTSVAGCFVLARETQELFAFDIHLIHLPAGADNNGDCVKNYAKSPNQKRRMFNPLLCRWTVSCALFSIRIDNLG
jgi:hypothetical protein